MTSYIPSLLAPGFAGGIQLALAGAYESRVHTMSKFLVPRAQFAGDTAVTLTDGSYNTRTAATNASTPKSATAYLANTNNTNSLFGKPLVIRVKRDEFTSEIKEYGVFCADGTYPGGIDPYNNTANTGARYRVNTSTGEIYVNNAAGLIEHKNPDGIINFATGSNILNTTQDTVGAGGDAGMQSTNHVVGMVEFDSLQGGALSAAQQQAADLSGVIQSLTSILRAINDGKRGNT